MTPRCPGCGDVLVSEHAYSRKDNSVGICWACSYFEIDALALGDRLTSPGRAVQPKKHDRDHYNRRTKYLRR